MVCCPMRRNANIQKTDRSHLAHEATMSLQGLWIKFSKADSIQLNIN